MLKWQTLKKISDTKAVKGMYFWAVFVPTAAKFLALIETPLHVKIFEATVALQLSLPFSWSAFFFAAVAFSAAHILFILFAPKIISEHPSYSHFREEGKTRTQLRKYGKEVKFNQIDMTLAESAASDNSNEGETQQMYWIIVEKAETMRTLARWAISILYISGFALMGAVLVQNIIFVGTQL